MIMSARHTARFCVAALCLCVLTFCMLGSTQSAYAYITSAPRTITNTFVGEAPDEPVTPSDDDTSSKSDDTSQASVSTGSGTTISNLSKTGDDVPITSFMIAALVAGVIALFARSRTQASLCAHATHSARSYGRGAHGSHASASSSRGISGVFDSVFSCVGGTAKPSSKKRGAHCK